MTKITKTVLPVPFILGVNDYTKKTQQKPSLDLEVQEVLTKL